MTRQRHRSLGGADLPTGARAKTEHKTEKSLRRRPFALRGPRELGSGVVFSSPHSGRAYFSDFVARARLDLKQLRASEDAFIDELFACATRYGAPVLAAVAPRAFVDLNRCPDDIDPRLVDGVGARRPNARVLAGLGVVPRIVAEGVAIYDDRLTLEEAQARIAHWHAPYQRQLVDLLVRARRAYGRALLIDCHSMPTAALSTTSRRRHASVDVVLGDRFGVSAETAFVDAIEEAFVAAGFRVARNAPFAGGFITEQYGRPTAGVSAVQIEIDRGLYLDQAEIAPSDEFAAMAERLEPVIERICGLVADPADETALAAE